MTQRMAVYPVSKICRSGVCACCLCVCVCPCACVSAVCPHPYLKVWGGFHKYLHNAGALSHLISAYMFLIIPQKRCRQKKKKWVKDPDGRDEKGRAGEGLGR